MKTKPIPTEFNSKSDFRTIIGNSINFLVTNYKELITSFVAICTLFIVPIATFSYIYPRTSHIHKTLIDFKQSFSDWSFLEAIRFLLTMFSITATASTTSSYIKLYITNKRKPSILEVWKDFVKRFFRQFLFFTFIYFILYWGFVFFIIPGIYLLPIVGLCTVIMGVENRSLQHTIRSGFIISNGNWGVISLILFISLLIIICILKTFTKVLSILFVSPASEPTSLLLKLSSTYIVHFLLIIPFTTLAFCYLANKTDKIR